MDSDWARQRFQRERSARLATSNADGVPRLVPVVFALQQDTIYSAVDDKPKTTSRLRRLDDIEANPRVSLLVDRYSEDWDELWWARADGTARVLATSGPDAAEAHLALAELASRYVQYQQRVPAGPVIAVDVTRWSGWVGSQDLPNAGR
jgi:PPOX class probable F420-dependent enzyme